MFFHRFVVPALGTSLLLSPVLVPPAAADPAWTPPQVLAKEAGLTEGITRPGLLPSVDTNSAGKTVAVWASEAGVKAAFRAPGRPWSRPTQIGSGLNRPEGQQVVIDREGNATAVWQVGGDCSWNDDPSHPYDETDLELRASYRPAGGTWRSQSVPGAWPGCNSGDRLTVAVDNAGTVTAAWKGEDKLLVSQHRPGGRWTAPKNVGAPPAGADGAEVVATPDGVTRLVWRDHGVWTSSSSAVGKWSEPTLVAGTDSARPPRQVGGVFVDADGDLTVAWETRSGTGDAFVEEIWTVTKPLGRNWQRPERAVATTEGSETDSAVGSFDIAGDGTSDSVVWNDRRQGRLLAATRSGDGPWGESTQISGGDTKAGFPKVTANRAGTMVAWVSASDKALKVRAVFRPVGGTWSDPTVLVSRDRNPRYQLLDYTAVGHPNGSFTVFFRLVYGTATTEFTDFVEDTAAPKVSMTKPGPRPVLGSRMRVSWAATDDLAGVRDVDVRVRSAGRDGRFSSWATWLNDTTATSAQRRVGPGRTYCLSARARDRVGNVGRWSASRCAATPVDDRAARASSGWSETRTRAAYQRTLTTTDRRGERLVLAGVRARQIGLVARTCPACGKVTVHHDGRLLGTVDLRSPNVRHKRVFVLKTYTTPRVGNVVVRVVSGGKPVQIDGFVAKQ